MKLLHKVILCCAQLLVAQISHAHTNETAGDAKRGEKQAAMCIGCHGIAGYKSSFPEVYRAPKIAGQNAGALFLALDAYKTGQRKHPSMRAVAAPLTKQEMHDLAAYYESLGK